MGGKFLKKPEEFRTEEDVACSVQTHLLCQTLLLQDKERCPPGMKDFLTELFPVPPDARQPARQADT